MWKNYYITLEHIKFHKCGYIWKTSWFFFLFVQYWDRASGSTVWLWTPDHPGSTSHVLKLVLASFLSLIRMSLCFIRYSRIVWWSKLNIPCCMSNLKAENRTLAHGIILYGKVGAVWNFLNFCLLAFVFKCSILF